MDPRPHPRARPEPPARSPNPAASRAAAPGARSPKQTCQPVMLQRLPRPPSCHPKMMGRMPARQHQEATIARRRQGWREAAAARAAAVQSAAQATAATAVSLRRLPHSRWSCLPAISARS